MALGRDFWTFWSAAVLANLGDGIRVAAFPLLAASLSDDPLLVGAVAASGALPWLLTGLVAGALADRHGARRLLLTADVLRVVVLALMVGALLVGRASVVVVAVVAFVLGVAETARDTAAQTVVPRLVPTSLLERANSRLVAGELAGNEFVGPLVGGVLFGAGAALPFFVHGATTAVAVLLVLSLPAAVLTAARSPDSPDTVAPGVRPGLRWLAGQRALRTLVFTVAAVAVADSAWFSVFVLYGERRLALDAGEFGALLAVGALGGLVGALSAERLVAGARHRAVVGWSAGVAAGVPCLLLLVAHLWAAAVVVVTTSAAFGVLNVATTSLRHRTVPQPLLGRVTATWKTSIYGASALGALGGGAVASLYGLEAPFLLSGALGAAATLAWVRGRGPLPQSALHEFPEQ